VQTVFEVAGWVVFAYEWGGHGAMDVGKCVLNIRENVCVYSGSFRWVAVKDVVQTKSREKRLC
jgi:hypothetical protein